jgi:hypothetical protein
MKRFRFRLSAFLIFVTAVAVFFGYSQYRRREILEVCAELKAEGYVFPVPNTFFDRIWQRKPVVGIIINVNEKEKMSRSKRLQEGGTLLSPTSDQQEIERFKKLGMVKYRLLTPRQQRAAEHIDAIQMQMEQRRRDGEQESE